MKRMNFKGIISLCLLPVLMVSLFTGCKDPGGERPTGSSVPSPTLSTQPLNSENGVLDLGGGLLLTKLGKYAGIYMEDGSNEIVQDIMMIVVKNTTGRDLQLARISVAYPGFTAEFEITNLPAAQTVVALEKSRHKVVEEDYEEICARDVVYFEQPMSLEAGKLEITGGNGYLEVKNISGEDIDGTVYVYYKNGANGTLYGGITYRAKLNARLEKGIVAKITTGHYNKNSSTVVQVVIVPQT